MFKNYLLTAWRNLKKYKLNSAINLVGLITGFAACMLIAVYIKSELSYDRFNIKADEIVRATMEYRKSGTVNDAAVTGARVGPRLAEVFPEVAAFTRTYISNATVGEGVQKTKEPGLLYADSSFLNIFSFPLLQGDPNSALDAPDKILLSARLAKKYFGVTALNSSLLGRKFNCNDQLYQISGVFQDPPDASQLKFNLLMPFSNLGKNVQDSWWTANWITYFLLKEGTDAFTFEGKVNRYMASAPIRSEAGLQGEDYLRYHMEPLLRVHLHSKLAGFEPNGSITYIYLFSLIAVVILIIAGVNYTNLTTAQAAGRMSEIGMRKVMGASRRQLFAQFIGEAVLITFVALLLALGLDLLLLSPFNEIAGTGFTITALLNLPVLLLFFVLALFVSLTAGLYPALILSSRKLNHSLQASSRLTGGSGLLRRALVVGQFAVSVFLIVFTLVVTRQLHYMQTKTLGYTRSNILVLPKPDGMNQTSLESFKAALAQQTGVEAVTAAYETPENIKWSDGIEATDEKGKHEISLKALPVDLGFVNSMEMQLLAGRDFTRSDLALLDTANDYANYQTPFLINETLAKRLGWKPEDAIGRVISRGNSGPVMGVVKDFNFSSLHDPIGPLLIFLDPGFSREIILRTNGALTSATIEKIGLLWQQYAADQPFDYHFLDKDYDRLYVKEVRTARLFALAAGLAILLATLGLFALAAFSVIQRQKEIGLRRVLGATVSSIVLLLSKEFLQLVAVALLIALPLGWWGAREWLVDFAYRVPLRIDLFLSTSIFLLLLTIVTVGLHALRTVFRNPVKALRSE